MHNPLTVDADEFGRAFARSSVAIRHALADHPLLTLEAVASLADRLPAGQVRRERGDLPLDDRGYTEVGTGLPSETILGIEGNGFRVSLREIQDDPHCVSLIATCHREIASLLGRREGGVYRPSAYIFVTAPGGTTPMHFDGEHSFLLQILGSKTVHTVPRVEPNAIQRELDHYYDGRPCRFDHMR